MLRWYAPALGRFLSEDSLLGEPTDPPSRHLYAYGAGQPVGRWDPDGRSYIDEWFAASARERKRCALLPWECGEWKEISEYAFRVAGHGTGDRSDAMRHCIWQCLLARKLGWQAAKDWGDLHEIPLAQINRLPAPKKARQLLEREMDLRNNIVGRSLASRVRLQGWGIWTEVVFADGRSLCGEALHGRRLWVIQDGRLVRTGRAGRAS